MGGISPTGIRTNLYACRKLGDIVKLVVFSDTRQPTKADGGHGLGMSAHSIASGLAARGHDVTLCAGHGSEFGNGRL